MFIYRSLLLSLFLLLAFPQSESHARMSDEWQFVAVQNGVKFFWRQDPTWHFLEIKAQNSSGSYINYEYNYTAYAGSSPVYEGKNRWIRLRDDDQNIIKLAKDLYSISRVKLTKLKVERYR